MRPDVLLLETIDPAAHQQLEAGARAVSAADPSAESCLHAAATATPRAIMTRGKGRVTPELLDACPDVVAVARCGVGLDNIDVDACSARGVRVLNLPGANAMTIVEHTIMLMLATVRGLVPWAGRVRDGAWSTRGEFSHDEVRGKTLGVIGLGAIGGGVAAVGAGLGMRVVYTDVRDLETSHERVSFDELIERSDVISLHCQLTDATRGMLDAGVLARMKNGAVLINTARGGLIDQAALTQVLGEGHLGGFAADVLDGEPPEPDDPLLGMPNVVLTPHVGSLTRTTYREMCLRSVQNVLGVLGGGEPMPGTVANAADLGASG